MNWEFLTGDINWDSYGGVFVSDMQNPVAGYEYWITNSVDPIEDEQWARSLGFKDREDVDGYHLSCTEGDDGSALVLIQAFIVFPKKAGKEAIAKARESWGWDEEEYKEFKRDRGKLADVELLHTYGTRAPLDIELYGYNAEELLEQAKHEAEFLGGTFFGFQMDRQRNMVGATGWDLLKGNVWGKHK